MLDAIAAQGLLPRVAHLAFSLPQCSCLHTAFLEAFSGHTLPSMPRAVWAPLLEANLGWPQGSASLPALPTILLQHGVRLTLPCAHDLSPMNRAVDGLLRCCLTMVIVGLRASLTGICEGIQAHSAREVLQVGQHKARACECRSIGAEDSTAWAAFWTGWCGDPAQQGPAAGLQ